MSNKRIAIIGGGAIGIEAALYGATLGHQVRLYERDQVGGNMRAWGHVRMFSPWRMNVTPLGRRRVEPARWDEEACPTGQELVEQYLLPLSRCPELRGAIVTGASVIQVGRKGRLKHDAIGDPRRGDSPFRLLLRRAGGEEAVEEAEVVIDASGVYGTPSPVGEGGIPAIGEIENRDRIAYRIDDLLGRDRARYQGKTTLVVGAGHSAATTIVALQALCEAAPGTRGLWAVRADRKLPFDPDGADPLAERARLTRAANAIAEGACPAIRYLPRRTVEAIRFDPAADRFQVTLGDGSAATAVEVDRIVACTGLGPDNSIYRQLQVHECYATRGPMALAAALLGETSADCLAQKSQGAKVLRNPEPGFFIVGHKSYGTSPSFLLRVGHEQVRDVFQLIEGDPTLDLYGPAA